MIVSRDPEKPRRLQKRHLVPPDRWTAEQPEFLGFSFPSCSTPVLGPTTDPSEGHGRTRDPELQMIRQDLNTYRFGARHAGVWELFDDPGAYYKPDEMIFFRYGQRRHFAKLTCLIFSPIRTDPRKARIAAYVDEGCIRHSRSLKATTDRQLQTANARIYRPYIAALLIAVAQGKYSGHENHVTASVLFSENPTRFTKDPVSEFLVYTAKIPIVLLEYLKKPTRDRPNYDPISVSCVSVPAEPLETLRERIVMVMPDEEPDYAGHDSAEEERASSTEDRSSTDSCKHAGKSSDPPSESSVVDPLEHAKAPVHGSA